MILDMQTESRRATLQAPFKVPAALLHIHYWMPLIVVDLKRSSASWAKGLLCVQTEKFWTVPSNLESIFVFFVGRTIVRNNEIEWH